VFFTVFYTVFFNRQFRVAISADIEPFYHRIGVPQHYQTTATATIIRQRQQATIRI
jgi:hypothetical protein